MGFSGWSLRIVVCFSLLGALPMLGCVSKAEFTALQGEYDAVVLEKEAAADKCQSDIAGLNIEKSALAEKSASLAADKKYLSQENSVLQSDKAELLAEKNRLNDEKNRQAQQQRKTQQMVNRLRREVDSSKTKIRAMKNYLKIDIVDKLMFASGQAKVSREGHKILAQLAPTLKRAKNKEILIIGHTDDLVPSARLARKYPSNWELSAARAAAIVHVLEWGYDIAPERMVIQGVADYRPLTVAAKDKSQTRKTNRVVEIILRALPKK